MSTKNQKVLDTVWLVWQGRYSDKSVVGVYHEESDAKLLEKFINDETDNWNQVRIEQVAANYHIEPISLGLMPFQIILSIETMEVIDVDAVERHETHKWPSAENAFQFGKTRALVSCWAKDRAHAIKIASERLAAWKAQGALRSEETK